MKEFKIIEFKKSKYSNEAIEKQLEEKSSEGWEVVSMNVDMSADLRGVVIVLLQKEKS
jgi:hypothetical protein